VRRSAPQGAGARRASRDVRPRSRRDVARGVRAPRPEGPLCQGARGRDPGVHRRVRPLRGAHRRGTDVADRGPYACRIPPARAHSARRARPAWSSRERCGLKLLVLGGTQFVGRAVTEIALERGHELTLFHRGRTNPDLFPEAEHLHGDRDHDLAALEGRSFDAVVDTSGYVPRAVRASVDALADTHYVFVSTISVYADFARGPDEESPVHLRGDGYGELKAACERELPEGALIVRPGLI